MCVCVYVCVCVCVVVVDDVVLFCYVERGREIVMGWKSLRVQSQVPSG